MFIEGMYQSAIGRILKKNYNTIHSHIYRESKKAEYLMKLREERIKREKAEIISFDEMWTYEGIRKGKNRNSKWIWTAVVELENGYRKHLFEIGDRNEETFLKSAEKNTRQFRI